MSLSDGDPFQFLSFGGTLSRTFRIFLEHADVFLTLSAVVMVPFLIIVATYFLVAVSWAIREAEAEATGDYMGFYPHHIPMLATVLGFQTLTYAVVTIIGRGAMCRAVAEMYLGQTPDWKQCLLRAWQRKVPLLGASLFVAVGILVPALLPVGIFAASVIRESFGLVLFGTLVLLAFVALVLYAYASTIMVTPSLVIEPLPIPPSDRYCGFICVEGLKRSWALSAGSRCYILCSLCCMFFIHEIVRQLLRNLFTNGGIFDSYFTIVGILVMMIPVALFLPLYAILETVIFLNLRVGRESLNNSVLETDLSVNERAAPNINFGAGIGAAGAVGDDYRQVPLMDADGSYSAPMVGGNEGVSGSPFAAHSLELRDETVAEGNFYPQQEIA